MPTKLFQKGNPIRGSRKGIPNKSTKELKDMIRQALDEAGGVDYLTKQAEKNPAAFMALISKILPKDVNIGNQDNAFVVKILGFTPKNTTDS